MKENKTIYVTKINYECSHPEYELYPQRIFKRRLNRYEKYTQEVGCQYDIKKDNEICTRQAIRLRRPEVGYFGSPKQIYAYHETRSFTDIGVGSVKALMKKRVRKIYLPETNDRGVGSSDLTPFIFQKPKQRQNSYYDHKRTSSKCVGGIIEYNTGCLLSKKLSPIIQTISGTTSPIDLSANKNQEIGSKTITNLVTTTTQVHTEVIDKGTTNYSNIKAKEGTKIVKQPKHNKSKVIDTFKFVESSAKEAEKVYSSDSLIQHVHNLEVPSLDKPSHMSEDPMENKLEIEYKKIFSTKSEEERATTDRNNSDIKSASLLKRRFEALRRGLTKKEDSKRNAALVIKVSSQISATSHKDVSINSDPPSLEARSYSNTKTYSPYTSVIEHDRIYDRNSMYRESISSRKEKDSFQSNRTEDSDNQGVKGMFKLWGKKFNLEEENYKNNPNPKLSISISKKSIKRDNPEIVLKTTAEGTRKRRFSFFRKKSKDKPKPYKPKKGVTTGRCEVNDGLMIKIGAQNNYEKPDILNEATGTKISKEYDEILRKAWLKKYLTHTIESQNSVRIRWNNKTFTTSSSTLFELMDTVYKGNAGTILKSKSEIIAVESSYYKSFVRQQVNFAYQNVEAWMIPKTIPDKPIDLPAKIKCNNPSKEENDNIKIGLSDQKWFIDKSKAFSHQIEVVLHSNNFVKLDQKQSSEYLRIDIPKGFFIHSNSDNKQQQSSDEQVFNVVEYETGSEFKTRSSGDHKISNIQVTINVKASEEIEPAVLKSMIKTPVMQRSVIIQGSNVYIPKTCNVVGVGIITQRELKEIRKPILKIRDDNLSDEESEHNLLSSYRKSKFAESYLREYYRNWTPLGIDFNSWCVSDSHLRCCPENSGTSYQIEGTRSCPNISEDFQSATVVSSCETSSFHHFVAYVDEQKLNEKFSTKFLKKIYNVSEKKDVDASHRSFPKDSIEVFKRRKVYALSNKSKWASADDEPHSVPSNESRGAENKMNDTKGIKSCCKAPEPKHKKAACNKKRVSMPICGKAYTDGHEEMGDGSHTIIVPPGILAFKGVSGCDTCKNPGNIKTAVINSDCRIEIPPPPCKTACDTSKKAPCSKKGSPLCSSVPKRPIPPPCIKPKPCDPASPPSPPCGLSTPPYTKPHSPCMKPSPTNIKSPCKKLSPLCKKSSPPCKKLSPLCKKPSPPCKKPSPPCKKTSPTCKTPSPPIAKSSTPCKKQSPPQIQKSCPKSSSPVCKKPVPPANKPCPPDCGSDQRPSPLCNIPKVLGIKLQSPGRSPTSSECSDCSKDANQTYFLPKTIPRSGETTPNLELSPQNSIQCQTSKFPVPLCKPRLESPDHTPPRDPKSVCSPGCKGTPKQSPPTTPKSCCSPGCKGIKHQKSSPSKIPSPEPLTEQTWCPICKKLSKSNSNLPGSQDISCCNSANCSDHDMKTKTKGLGTKLKAKLKKESSPPKCTPPPPCPPSLKPCVSCGPCADCQKEPQDFPWPTRNQISNQSLLPKSLSAPQEDVHRFEQKPTFSPNLSMNSMIRIESLNNCNKQQVSQSCQGTPCIVKKTSPCMTPKTEPVDSGTQGCNVISRNKNISSGIHIKMNPSKKSTTTAQGQYGCIKLSSKENLTIRTKTYTPSTEEIREGLNIKVQDEDGQTLYERKDYRRPHSDGQHRPSVLCDMYRNSNVIHSLHRMSAKVIGEAITSNKVDNEMSEKSEASLTNMIEIQFQIKVTQGDKTTEIALTNDEDKNAGKEKIYKAPEEIFLVKNDSVRSAESKDAKNDINIRIVIKKFKSKNEKKKSKNYNYEFSREIADKFHTVSTGYSSNLCNEDANNVFSVHRATVDLTTSEKSKHDVQIVELKRLTEPMPINILKSVHSKHSEKKVEGTRKKSVASKVHIQYFGKQENTSIHDTAKEDLSKKSDILNVSFSKEENVGTVVLGENYEIEKNRVSIISDFSKRNYFKEKYDYTDTDVTEKDDLTEKEDLTEREDVTEKDEFTDKNDLTEREDTTERENFIEKDSKTEKDHFTKKDGQREKEDSNQTDNYTKKIDKVEITPKKDHDLEVKFYDVTVKKSFEQNFEAPASTDAEDQDLVLEVNTSTENDTAPSLEVIIKPVTRDEKKEMLKHVFEKVHKTKVKSRTRMKKLKDMLKSILTSDSSENDEAKVSELATDLTYTSLKQNFFRDSDSMNNYYNFESLSEKDGNQPATYPTEEKNSKCSKSSDVFSTEERAHKECMCNALATRLNMCKIIGGACCCNKKIVKKDEEIICDIKSDDYQVDLKAETNYVDVETQHSKYYAHKGNSNDLVIHNYSKSNIIETCNIVKVEEISEINEVNRKERLTLKRTFSPHMNHVKECQTRRLNTILKVYDNDEIVLVNGRTRVSTDKKNKKYPVQKPLVRHSDILQSFEAKRAVLEIYAEKTISNNGEHFVAKLPKFVYDRENEILMNYDAIASNDYKALCKRNLII